MNDNMSQDARPLNYLSLKRLEEKRNAKRAAAKAIISKLRNRINDYDARAALEKCPIDALDYQEEADYCRKRIGLEFMRYRKINRSYRHFAALYYEQCKGHKFNWWKVA